MLVLVLAAAAGWSVLQGNPFVGEWRDAFGRPVPDESFEGEGFVLDSFIGSGHCDWDSATLLLISWPPGRLDADWQTGDVDDGTVRLYVRDPERLFIDYLDGEFDGDTELPSAATATGLHQGGWEIWTSPNDDEIFLEGPDRVERWQRARTYLACG